MAVRYGLSSGTSTPTVGMDWPGWKVVLSCVHAVWATAVAMVDSSTAVVTALPMFPEVAMSTVTVTAAVASVLVMPTAAMPPLPAEVSTAGGRRCKRSYGEWRGRGGALFGMFCTSQGLSEEDEFNYPNLGPDLLVLTHPSRHRHALLALSSRRIDMAEWWIGDSWWRLLLCMAAVAWNTSCSIVLRPPRSRA